MKMNPLISIIIPCYNQASFLMESLESISMQTYENWECIIVNDGSTDDTEKIAIEWAQKDKRFKYFAQSNQGRPKARNAGLELCKGEWIQFLDCDDKIAHDKFEKSAQFFSSYDIIISDYSFFQNGKVYSSTKNFNKYQIDYSSIVLNWDIKYSIPIHCPIFKKSLVEPFEIRLLAKQDWFFWIKIFEKEPLTKLINENLAFYRNNPNGITKNRNMMAENEEIAYKLIYENISSHKLKEDFFKTRISYLFNRLNESSQRNEFLRNKLESTKSFKFRKWLWQIFKL